MSLFKPRLNLFIPKQAKREKMAICPSEKLLSFYLLACLISTVSYASRATPNFKIKAVNLGGWLVTEGWIKPSLFDGIPNKDLLDGYQVNFKSAKLGKFLCAESGGGTIIVANRTSTSGWEAFSLWRINETSFNFRVFNRQFIGLDNKQGNGVTVVASSNSTSTSETFEIVRKADDQTRIRIKAPNGYFLQAKTEDLVTADFVGSGTGWGDDDPSVFLMVQVRAMHGEFQVTNGYGPDKAPQVMRDHWNTFVVEEDFKFISENGLNAVRIPVGWWIASDPTPPKPYVGGSLQALDNAFSWAQYAKSPALLAVELINEPRAPEVSLDSLNKYYKAGYDAVRKHSATAFVVMSNRLNIDDPRELFPLASGLSGSVIDVHYYNLFSNMFAEMTVQENIDFVYNNRSTQLNYITTSNGPLTFVGEWVAEWNVGGATKEEYQRFAKSQLEVYGRASFGWAYWTLKNVRNPWSLEWVIKNGYIKL